MDFWPTWSLYSSRGLGTLLLYSIYYFEEGNTACFRSAILTLGKWSARFSLTLLLYDEPGDAKESVMRRRFHPVPTVIDTPQDKILRVPTL